MVGFVDIVASVDDGVDNGPHAVGVAASCDFLSTERDLGIRSDK